MWMLWDDGEEWVGRVVRRGGGAEGGGGVLRKRLCKDTISSCPQPSGPNIHSPLITTAAGLISPEETQDSGSHCSSFFVHIRYKMAIKTGLSS